MTIYSCLWLLIEQIRVSPTVASRVHGYLVFFKFNDIILEDFETSGESYTFTFGPFLSVN